MQFRTIFVIIFALGSFWTSAQEPVKLNRTIIDTTKHQEILYGYCNRAGLKGPLFMEYYEREYNAYVPKAEIIGQLGQKETGYRIVIVMGSWCGDSQEQVPRFLKILDAIGYSENYLTLICVDRKKQCDEGGDLVHQLVIEKVPTIIVFRGDKEAGRIIETPTLSLEEDLLKILEN